MLDWVGYESFKSGFKSNHESAAFTQLAGTRRQQVEYGRGTHMRH
jgi:hypothetical protein